MTSRTKRWLIILAVLVVLRTILTAPRRNGEIYISTRADFDGIGELLHPTGFQLFGDVMCYLKYPALALVACDIPVAVMADSLLLPYDFYIGRQNGFIMQIIDDQGNPVPNAKIYGYGQNNIRGESNDQGLYRWASDSRSIEYFIVSKAHYYDTEQQPRQSATVTAELAATHTNVLRVVLKRCRNPIAMYAKIASVDLPAMSGAYGYDLMVGDLVAPHGKGSVSDLVFQVAKGKSRYLLDLDITFSSAFDGIQRYDASRDQGNDGSRQSKYIFPYDAPANGYESSLFAADKAADSGRSEHEKAVNRDHNVNYLFRVRANNVTNGLYGRVYGFFRAEIHGSTTPNVEFAYFLNPTGTRSLEWDGKQNLITEMSRYEYSPNER